MMIKNKYLKYMSKKKKNKNERKKVLCTRCKLTDIFTPIKWNTYAGYGTVHLATHNSV